MPWSVRKSKRGSGYDIVKDDTGAVVGHTESRTEAEASVRARYAAYNKHTERSEMETFYDKRQSTPSEFTMKRGMKRQRRHAY